MEPTTSFAERRVEFGSAECPEFEPGVMLVFYEGDKPVAVDFLCPCNCGHSVYTPIGLGHPHKWEFFRGPTGGPTLSPSIRFRGGCKAHFTITDGKVTMHDDSGK